MKAAVKKLPEANIKNSGTSDPLEGILPEGLTLTVRLVIDPEKGMISADLRENPPSVDCGLNVSRAAAMSSVAAGIFNNLRDVPRNAGSFRCLVFMFANDSVVGSPVFPHSCSTATTNLAERLVNITQSAFAQLGEGFGLAEGGTGLGAGQAVVSGFDARYGLAVREPHYGLEQRRAPRRASRTDGLTTACPSSQVSCTATR